jgi:flagellar hook assembly protein FlgD
MFMTRLDIPSGGAIPDNWHTLVRTFAFDVQNIRLQRGGVTVLNNVINSNNREAALIRYNLARPGRVTIQVFTLDGTLVKSIRRNELRGTGDFTDYWDGTNNSGRPVARGMYFVRVVAPDIDEIRKIMVIRQ